MKQSKLLTVLVVVIVAALASQGVFAETLFSEDFDSGTSLLIFQYGGAFNSSVNNSYSSSYDGFSVENVSGDYKYRVQLANTNYEGIWTPRVTVAASPVFSPINMSEDFSFSYELGKLEDVSIDDVEVGVILSNDVNNVQVNCQDGGFGFITKYVDIDVANRIYTCNNGSRTVLHSDIYSLGILHAEANYSASTGNVTFTLYNSSNGVIGTHEAVAASNIPSRVVVFGYDPQDSYSGEWSRVDDILVLGTASNVPTYTVHVIANAVDIQGALVQFAPGCDLLTDIDGNATVSVETSGCSALSGDLTNVSVSKQYYEGVTVNVSADSSADVTLVLNEWIVSVKDNFGVVVAAANVEFTDACSKYTNASGVAKVTRLDQGCGNLSGTLSVNVTKPGPDPLYGLLPVVNESVPVNTVTNVTMYHQKWWAIHAVDNVYGDNITSSATETYAELSETCYIAFNTDSGLLNVTESRSGCSELSGTLTNVNVTKQSFVTKTISISENSTSEIVLVAHWWGLNVTDSSGDPLQNVNIGWDGLCSGGTSVNGLENMTVIDSGCELVVGTLSPTLTLSGYAPSSASVPINTMVHVSLALAANTTGFDGDTTDMSDPTNLTQPILHVTDNMKIQWSGVNLDFAGADFAQYVTYSPATGGTSSYTEGHGVSMDSFSDSTAAGLRISLSDDISVTGFTLSSVSSGITRCYIDVVGGSQVGLTTSIVGTTVTFSPSVDLLSTNDYFLYCDAQGASYSLAYASEVESSDTYISWTGGYYGGDDPTYFNNIDSVDFDAAGEGAVEGPAWINVDSANLPVDVNGSANLTFYNALFTNPVLFADGVECTACSLVSYVNNTALFTVPHFTNYSMGSSGSFEPISPGNGTQVSDVNTNFTFNVSGSANETCDLYLDGMVKDSVVLSGDGQYVLSNASYLESINLDGSDHVWAIDCNGSVSDNLTFTVKDSNYPFIVNSCRVLNSSGMYMLQNDLNFSAGEKCINITANNVTVEGAGYTILGVAASTSNHFYAERSSGEQANITVQNIVLDRTSTGDDAGHHFRMINTYGVTIDNVTMYVNNGRYGGVGYFENTDGLLVKDSYVEFDYESSGLSLTNVDDAVIQDTLFDGGSQRPYKIGIAGGGNITIQRNNFTGGSVSYFRFRDLYVSGSLSGLHVLNNTFTSAYQVFESTATVTGAEFVGNHINYHASRNTLTLGAFSGDIYNNYIGGPVNHASGTVNWNTTETVGTNVIGGSSIGGNYYSANDPCIDVLRDGFCDDSYEVVSGVYDYLPLIPLRDLFSGATNVTSPDQNDAVRGENVTVTVVVVNYEEVLIGVGEVTEDYVFDASSIVTNNAGARWGQSFVATGDQLTNVQRYYASSQFGDLSAFTVYEGIMITGTPYATRTSSADLRVNPIDLVEGQNYTIYSDGTLSFQYFAYGTPYADGCSFADGGSANCARTVAFEISVKDHNVVVNGTNQTTYVVDVGTGDEVLSVGSRDVSGQGATNWTEIDLRVSNLGVITSLSADEGVYWILNEDPRVSWSLSGVDGYGSLSTDLYLMNGSSVVASMLGLVGANGYVSPGVDAGGDSAYPRANAFLAQGDTLTHVDNTYASGTSSGCPSGWNFYEGSDPNSPGAYLGHANVTHLGCSTRLLVDIEDISGFVKGQSYIMYAVPAGSDESTDPTVWNFWTYKGFYNQDPLVTGWRYRNSNWESHMELPARMTFVDNANYNVSFNESVTASYETAHFKVEVTDTLFNESDNTTIVVADAITEPLVTGPSTEQNGDFNVTWSASVENLGTISYTVQQSLDGGAFTLVNTTTNTYLQITGDFEGDVVYQVKAEDTYVNTTYDNGTEFAIVLSPQLGSQVCALTYPNEDNLPAIAELPVNFSVYAPLGFTSPSAEIKLKFGGETYTSTDCTYAVVDSTHRDYSCNVSMNYWYEAGDYDLNITFTDAPKVVTVEYSGECAYGQLVASTSDVSAVAFSGAGPGISNTISNVPVTMRNTGNMELNLKMTSYDLSGRTNPSIKLPASAFKAGASLGTSVAMVDSSQENLSMTIEPASGAEDDVWLWLSMPVGQLIQDYYSETPWQVVGTG